jgi:hypothetical protein
MKPSLHVISGGDLFLQRLVARITTIECTDYFSSHLEAEQREQRNFVSRFQGALVNHLRPMFDDVEWKKEYCPNPATRDSIDIFGKTADRLIAIELDKYRADQVAKKFVSRMAALPSAAPVYFLSVCYPGTERMNKNECVKYFGYCKTLAVRMGTHYAGLIIQ